MSTARAARTNRSNGSDQGDKEQLGHMRHRLGQSQSSSDLTAGRSSEHSGETGSVSSDASRDLSPDAKAAGGGSSNSSASTRHHRGVSWQERSSSWSDFDGHGEGRNDEKVGKALSKMENDDHSPRAAKRHTVDLTSSSPPLTPQDWVEAANANPRSRKEGPHKSNRRGTHSGTTTDSDLSSASRSSGTRPSVQRRRNTLDTAVHADSSPEPTLDLCALEPDAESVANQSSKDGSDTNSRRLNLRPSFLNRLAHPRRLQPSPTGDARGESDGAPAPVIHKARNISSKSPPDMNGNDKLPTTSRHKKPSPPAPTSYHRKTLPHPSTEPDLFAHETAHRPVTASSKDKHKRRGSIGIFGWMIGGNGKKVEPSSSSSLALQPHNAVKAQKAASRPSPRSAGAAPQATQAASKAANVNDKNSSTGSSKQSSDAELSRRPRYVERRARRN